MNKHASSFHGPPGHTAPGGPAATADLAAAKAALRQEMSRRRRALAPEEYAARSHAAQEFLLNLAPWRTAAQVACYSAVRGEVDTTLLMERAWDQGLRLLLPRCRPDIPGEMSLACATCEGDLVPGAFNIPEPRPDRCPEVLDHDLDLIILPGLAFDRQGYRLGYGGGYYDRLLAPRQASSNASPRPRCVVGLCFSFQLVDALPRQAWDVPVHAIVTDTEVLWPSR